MYTSSFLIAVLPIAFAVPAPLPAPVANPAPSPIAAPPPVPQGKVTNPITGIIGSLIQGSQSIGSVVNAVPAIVSDLAEVSDAAGLVVSKCHASRFSSSGRLSLTLSIEAIADGTILGTDVPAVAQKLFQAVQPTSRPTSIADAIQKAAKANGITDPNATQPPPQQNIIENALSLILNGFTTTDVAAIAAGGVRSFGASTPAAMY
jgi:hypothetical protein